MRHILHEYVKKKFFVIDNSLLVTFNEVYTCTFTINQIDVSRLR